MNGSNDSDDLLVRVREGDESAVDQLMDLHRPRLKHLIVHRMDARLASRLDPSDVQRADHPDEYKHLAERRVRQLFVNGMI